MDNIYCVLVVSPDGTSFAGLYTEPGPTLPHPRIVRVLAGPMDVVRTRAWLHESHEGKVASLLLDQRAREFLTRNPNPAGVYLFRAGFEHESGQRVEVCSSFDSAVREGEVHGIGRICWVLDAESTGARWTVQRMAAGSYDWAAIEWKAVV